MYVPPQSQANLRKKALPVRVNPWKPQGNHNRPLLDRHRLAALSRALGVLLPLQVQVGRTGGAPTPWKSPASEITDNDRRSVIGALFRFVAPSPDLGLGYFGRYPNFRGNAFNHRVSGSALG
jgi:hypothetical protein